MAGATSVLAADIDRIALAAVALNAEANGCGERIATTAEDLLSTPGVRPLTRTGEVHSGQSCEGSDPFPAVVLVGDLFYERQLAERVLAYIEAAATQGAAVLIGDPQRSYFPRGRFTQAAEYQVPVTRELEDAEIKRTAVWRL
jgi:predicted nicotinamide N-methyase